MPAKSLFRGRHLRVLTRTPQSTGSKCTRNEFATSVNFAVNRGNLYPARCCCLLLSNCRVADCRVADHTDRTRPNRLTGSILPITSSKGRGGPYGFSPLGRAELCCLLRPRPAYPKEIMQRKYMQGRRFARLCVQLVRQRRRLC